MAVLDLASVGALGLGGRCLGLDHVGKAHPGYGARAQDFVRQSLSLDLDGILAIGLKNLVSETRMAEVLGLCLTHTIKSLLVQDLVKEISQSGDLMDLRSSSIIWLMGTVTHMCDVHSSGPENKRDAKAEFVDLGMYLRKSESSEQGEICESLEPIEGRFCIAVKVEKDYNSTKGVLERLLETGKRVLLAVKWEVNMKSRSTALYTLMLNDCVIDNEHLVLVIMNILCLLKLEILRRFESPGDDIGVNANVDTYGTSDRVKHLVIMDNLNGEWTTMVGDLEKGLIGGWVLGLGTSCNSLKLRRKCWGQGNTIEATEVGGYVFGNGFPLVLANRSRTPKDGVNGESCIIPIRGTCKCWAGSSLAGITVMTASRMSTYQFVCLNVICMSLEKDWNVEYVCNTTATTTEIQCSVDLHKSGAMKIGDGKMVQGVVFIDSKMRINWMVELNDSWGTVHGALNVSGPVCADGLRKSSIWYVIDLLFSSSCMCWMDVALRSGGHKANLRCLLERGLVFNVVDGGRAGQHKGVDFRDDVLISEEYWDFQIIFVDSMWDMCPVLEIASKSGFDWGINEMLSTSSWKYGLCNHGYGTCTVGRSECSLKKVFELMRLNMNHGVRLVWPMWDNSGLLEAPD